ncbi:hypothetical protein GY45DRAFT_104684 [Cubamyces sp. BRFM 1775]|nr:hypothetical protein GY45DRAFT_104684 [Cubamyces sp. BRFM 1775]
MLAVPRPSTRSVLPILAADAGPQSPPALDNSYGALLLGTCFGMMLYGLTINQVYRYMRLYPKDRLWIKCLVAAVLIFETVHSMLCIVAIYYHLVTHYFDPASLAAGHWSTRTLTPIMVSDGTGKSQGCPQSHRQALTIILCQCFYVFRVYQLGPHRIYRLLVLIAAVCIICQFAFFIVTAVEVYRLSLKDFPPYGWLASTGFGCAALAELFLTGTLVVVLWRSRTGSKRTDSIIELLIVYSVNTGLLTGVFELLGFIFALILPGNLIYVAVASVAVKLYANSMLAVLNSRRSLSQRMMQDVELGSFEPRRVLGAGPSRQDGPLETWKARRGAGPTHLTTTTDIVFASNPDTTNSGSTSEDSAIVREDEGNGHPNSA